jgi:hypothetical protein
MDERRRCTQLSELGKLQPIVAQSRRLERHILAFRMRHQGANAGTRPAKRR